MPTTRAHAFADVFRDLARTGTRAQPRERVVAAVAAVIVLVIIAVVAGVAWGVAIGFASLSVLLVDVAARQKLPARPVRTGPSRDELLALTGATVATDDTGHDHHDHHDHHEHHDRYDRHDDDAPGALPEVRVSLEPPLPLEKEMVRVYPTGAFGPASGALFRLRVHNEGRRSAFRVQVRPVDGSGVAGEGFDVAWVDTPAHEAEIRRGRSRMLRVAACYQDGPRRLLRFFSPAVRILRRDGAAPRQFSVASDHELPPVEGSLSFAVVVLDEAMREVASERFTFGWGDIDPDDADTRLPTIVAA